MSPPLKVALLLWLAHSMVRVRKDERYVKLLLVCFAAIGGAVVVGNVLDLSSGLTPKYDLYLYAVDHTLGFSLSFQLGRIFGPSTVFLRPLACFYDTMFLSMLLVYELHMVRNGKPKRVAAALILNLCGGFLLYFLLPACGPIYAFHSSFPRHLPPWNGVRLLSIAAPPNAIPSVHTSTALLILWFCGKRRCAYPLAALNLICTLLATLASGEHYLIDLVVAVPFAAAVYAASGHAWKEAVVWLAATGGWMAALRWGSPWVTASPVLLGVACLMTVSIPWLSSLRAVLSQSQPTGSALRVACSE